VILDLTANPGQKVIVDTALHQRIAKMAMGRRIGHRRKEIETAKQHGIQPQLRARTPALGCHYLIGRQLEQDQRIITLRPDPEAP